MKKYIIIGLILATLLFAASRTEICVKSTSWGAIDSVRVIRDTIPSTAAGIDTAYSLLASCASFETSADIHYFNLYKDGYYLDSLYLDIEDGQAGDTLTAYVTIEDHSPRLSFIAYVKSDLDTLVTPDQKDSLGITIVSLNDDTLFSHLKIDSLGTVGIDPDSLTDGAMYMIRVAPTYESTDTVFNPKDIEFTYDADLGTQIIPIEIDTLIDLTTNSVSFYIYDFYNRPLERAYAQVTYNRPFYQESGSRDILNAFTANPVYYSDSDGLVEIDVPDNHWITITVPQADYKTSFYCTQDTTILVD